MAREREIVLHTEMKFLYCKEKVIGSEWAYPGEKESQTQDFASSNSTLEIRWEIGGLRKYNAHLDRMLS